MCARPANRKPRSALRAKEHGKAAVAAPHTEVDSPVAATADDVALPDAPPDKVDLTALTEAIARQIQACLDSDNSATVTSEQDSAPRNRRKSYRCPATGDRATALLKLGAERYTAKAIDESAAGVSLVVEGAVACQVGQAGLMRIASSWSEVQVMNVRQEPASTDGPVVSIAPQTRLGLLRVKDIEEPEDEAELTENVSWAEVKSLLAPFAPVMKPAVRVVGLLAAAVIVAVTLDWLLDNPETVSDPAHAALHVKGPRLEDLNPPEVSGPEIDAPPLAPVERERPRAAKRRPARAPAPASQPRASKPAPPQHAAKTAPMSQPPTEPARSSRPSVLVHPRSAERLSLSPEQHSRVREMIDDAGEAVDQALRSRLSAVSHSSPVTKAEHAADRIIEMLTSEQREAATKLLGEGSAASPGHDDPARTDDVPR